MENNRSIGPAGSMESRQRKVLAYGQFYGVLERQYELPDFSVAFIAANDLSVQGVEHSHESAHIIFILNGQYVSSASRVEHIVPLHSLIFVPAGTRHEDRFQTPDTRTLTISVSAARLEQARHYIQLPNVQSDFRHGEIAFLTRRLEAECDYWRDTSVLMAEGLCLELLARIAQRHRSKEQTPPRWLRTVRELLYDKCREAMSISEIAAAANVHPVHLSRTFRKFFHCTPGDYLRDCRLETAASLLRSKHASIADVAIESGFTDQSQLSKAFRRKFGITPAEFRRGNSNNV